MEYGYVDDIAYCKKLLESRQYGALSKTDEESCWRRIRQRFQMHYIRCAEWTNWCSDRIAHQLDCIVADDDERIIVETYMPFVLSIALKMPKPAAIAFSDMFQEGMIGLMRAMRRYDYRKGFKFSTYATEWVRQEMARYLDNHSRTIRISVSYLEYLKRCWRQGDELPFQEAVQTVHFEQEDCQEGNVVENFADPSADSLEEKVFQSQCTALINRRIALLQNPTDKTVIELLYGFNEEGTEYGFREVGKRLEGVTHTRIKQREVRALRSLYDEELKKLLSFF